MVNFYDTRLNKSGGVMLVEEKQEDYEAGKLNSPEKIALMACRLLHLDGFAEEHVYMLALNSVCNLLGVFFLSKGTADCSLASPREIYIRALSAGAVQIVLLHNHPSGSAMPSDFDLKLTERVKEAGELLGVRLADHIIIGGNSGTYLSFLEAGLIGKKEEAQAK